MAKETKYSVYLRSQIDKFIAQSEEHSREAETCVQDAKNCAADDIDKVIKKVTANCAKALEHERKANRKLRQALESLYKLKQKGNDSDVVVTEEGMPAQNETKILQAFSYTVFDTILFSITRGAAPDFTLISQSALFDTVYVNISRGFESYLFNDIPAAAVAVIHQGRNILDELREREDRFLDEPDLWDLYAPDIQSWWVNTALPLIFGERDPDWDNQPLPSHDEMKLWTEGEFSQRKHFPAVADLVEIAKDRALSVSETYDFRILLNA